MELLIRIIGITMTIVMFFYMPTFVAIMVHRRKNKAVAVTKFPEKRLTSARAKKIWRRYGLLDKENQTFPELFDALMTLDAMAIAKGYLHEGCDFLVHKPNCEYYRIEGYYGRSFDLDYSNEDIEDYCANCHPYFELELSVDDMVTAQDNRNYAIERAARELTVSELDAKMDMFSGLAERMRDEAKIHSYVTDKVYR